MNWSVESKGKNRHVNEWDSLIKESGLHIKWPEQIALLHENTENKLNKLVVLESSYANYPGYYQKQYVDSGATHDEAVALVTKMHNKYIRKIKRCEILLELCKKEYALRLRLIQDGYHPATPAKYANGKKIIDIEPLQTMPTNGDRSPIGTTYYLDSVSGSDAGVGTSTGDPWQTLGQYTTTSARTPGDIAVLRGGLATVYWDAAADLAHDEDGTYAAPVYVEADFGDAFGDHVDVSATATATLTAGSKTITFTSDVSGVIAADDWIYVSGDNNREFCYHVASVSTVTVTTYLPYLGEQIGSGKTVINMQSFPQVGNVSNTGNLTLTADNFWAYNGLVGTSNASGSGGGLFSFSQCIGFDIGHISYTGGAAASPRLVNFTSDDMTKMYIHDIYLKGAGLSVDTSQNVFNDSIRYKNIFMDFNSDTGMQARITGNSTLENFEYSNSSGSSNWLFFANSFDVNLKLRNISYPHATASGASSHCYAGMEDVQGTTGSTSAVIHNADSPTTQALMQDLSSDTTTVRSGGSALSIAVTPKDIYSGIKWGELTILDLPLKMPASAVTLSIFLKPDDTTEWTADPTASELFLEIEYLGNASNSFRSVKKSTDVIDMNGSSAWQSLSVTVTQAQAGLAYLKLKYRKPKESGKTNKFYVDPLPVIS